MVRPSPAALTLSPTLGALVLLLGSLTADRLRAARRRAEPVGRGRLAALAAAWVLLLATLASPIETVALGYLLSAHLLQVTILMGFVPPLLLVGLPRGGRAWPRGAALAGRVAVHPGIAIVLVNAVFFGWHAPRLYDTCLAHPELYSLQLATLLGVSVLFWWPIVEPRGPGRWSMSPVYKLGYILLATIPQTLAGLIFAISRRLIYAGYDGSILGMTPLSDQQIAGASMALLSKLALFAAFSVVLWRMFEGEDVDGDIRDDGGGGDDDDRPAPVRPPMPSWLGLLDAGPFVDEPEPVRREPAPSAPEPVPASREEVPAR